MYPIIIDTIIVLFDDTRSNYPQEYFPQFCIIKHFFESWPTKGTFPSIYREVNTAQNMKIICQLNLKGLRRKEEEGD